MGLCTPSAVLRTGAADIQRAAELRTRHRAWWLVLDTKIDHKLRKNSREQVIKTYSKMMPKSIQNGGSGASFWGVGGVILEPFWGSGRILTPKCHPGPSWWPSWWPTWPQLGAQNGAKIDKKSKQQMIKI